MLAPEIAQQLQAILLNSTDLYEVARAAAFLQTERELAGVAAPHFLRALKGLRLSNAADRFAGVAQPSTGGLIPWRSRARRFAANIAALAAREGDAAAQINDAAARLADFELHQTADGNFEILDLRRPLAQGWIAGLVNHKQAANAFQFDRQKTPVPNPVGFDGISFGWTLLRVLEATEHSFLNYSCPIYIFESDPLALAMLFHMHDLTQVMAGPRLRWFVGSSPESVLADFRVAAESQPTWSLPGAFVRCLMLDRAPLDIQAAVAALQAQRAARRAALDAEIAAYYADKKRPFWAARFDDALSPGAARPLRVLGLTSRFTTVLQFSMAELQAAVRQSGTHMEVAIEADDQSLENPWLELIASFKPDLIVQISRMRYENPYLPANVPFLTWDQDNLVCMRTPQATASLDDLTFVAGQGALQGYAFLNWPARNVSLCHLAAATHRYQLRLPTAEEESQWGCDFSYLSNAAAAPGALRDQHLVRFGGGAATVFGEMCERILGNVLDPGGMPWNEPSVRIAIKEIAEESRVGLPDETFRELLLSSLLVADRAFRHQTLQWVSDYCKEAGKTLRIYGSGWEAHPTLAAHAAGIAQQGEQMQGITLATRINLQIIGTGMLHPRLLDGLAAGGFFMFRRTLNDVGNPAYLGALERISRYVFQHDIQTMAVLDEIADPDLAAAWRTIAGEYRKSQRESGLEDRTILRGIATAHQLRHPTQLLPAIHEIGFETPEQLAVRASHFLADPGARAATAGRLRASIAENFSYDARWRQFVTHIHDALR